jgi:hypothetical protein
MPYKELKVKVSLYTSRRHIRRTEIWLLSLLPSAIVRCEWSTSRLGHFDPGKAAIYPLNKRSRRTSQTVRVFEQREKSLVLSGIRPQDRPARSNFHLTVSKTFTCSAGPNKMQIYPPFSRRKADGT